MEEEETKQQQTQTQTQEQQEQQPIVDDTKERKIDETDPEAFMKHMTKGRYIRNWVGFLFLGLINNLFYVLVNSSGQRLCADFHKENWIGAILWCNIAFGLVARVIHMFFLEETSFTSRFVAKAIGDMLGVTCLIVSILLGDNFFALSLLGVIFVGTSSSFGETVALCYLKKFPSDLVGGWSSGTGFAGVTGTLLYTLFITPWLDFSNLTIFSITSPLIILYIIIYVFLIKLPDGAAEIEKKKKKQKKEEKKRKKEEEKIKKQQQQSGDSKKPPKDDSTTTAVAVNETTPLSQDFSLNAHPKDLEQGEDQQAKETGGARLKRCVKLVWWPSLNLILVYFFEYVACTGGSDRAQGGNYKDDPNWFVRNCYVILNFCYQLGVVLSRSSLALFKIKHIGVLTVLQFINVVFWLFQAAVHMVQGYPIIWVLFAHMFYVGLLGGSSYVNVFYIVLHDDKIPVKDREYCVNISAFANTFGITASSIVIIILDNTIWKRDSIVTPTSSSSSSFSSSSFSF